MSEEEHPPISPVDKTEEDKTRLISLAEAAELYGFSADYLRQLINRDKLKAQKFGHIWATTPHDIENYIANRKQRGAFREDIDID